MKSKKNIKSIIIMAAVGIISLFFINMSLAANTGKISVETANLRKEADENSKILEQFSMNQEVEIIEKQGDWYKVKAKGMTGYLRKDLITVNNEEQIANKTNTANNQTEQTTAQENVATNETQQPANQTDNTVANQTEPNTVKQDNVNTTQEKDIELGKQVIGEDTKLKLVPVINATDTIEVKKGEEVTVVEVINNWVCVETKNTKGWIVKDKIQKEEQASNTTIKTAYTNSATVNVRQEPNKSSSIVTKLTNNTAVEVVSEQNGWSKVKVSGKEGYILTSLLSDKKQETSRSSTTRKEETTKKQANTTTQANNNATKTQTNATAQTNTQQAKTTTQPAATTPAPTSTAPTPAASGKGSSVVATARQYVGCKYVYGGTTPSGFDCSGFTSYVYKKFGVNLSRTAAGQYGNGTAVSRSQLQPGDLVMFGKSGISHVAIYAGGGTIVHAANSKSGVRTDSLNSRYYNKNYVGARRVL